MTTTTDLINANGRAEEPEAAREGEPGTSMTGGESTPDTAGESASGQTGQSRANNGKRSNWTVSAKADMQHRTITWTVRGSDEPPLVLDLSKVSDANRLRAEYHGFTQRVSDAAAMARDTKTGKSATPAQKRMAMARLVEHLNSGAVEWSPARAEGAGRTVKEHPNAELLRIALGIFDPEKSPETIAQFVSERSAAQITALVLSERLKDAMELAREQLREREAALAGDVDAEELLRGL